MFPSSNRGVGGTVGFPDVCLTPVGPATAPIPYPNLGLNAMAVPFSPNVYLTMVNALNMGSIIPLSNGDQAGLAHPTIMGPVTFTMGNPFVYVNMLPAINLCSPSTGNNMNNGLGAMLIASVTNVFFSYRPGHGARRALDGAALEELAGAGREAVFGCLLDCGVGYVDLPSFGAETPTRAAREIARLERDGARALILDLRDNPGGDAAAALRLAEDFLPEGSVLARRVDPDGDEIPLIAFNEGAFGLPVLVLVNRWTASAAEVLAGCLQWHGRARLVGETTFGKGRARKVAAAEGGYVEVDAALFTLPGGEPIDGKGLSPDIHAAGERGPSIDEDPAVSAAIRAIREVP